MTSPTAPRPVQYAVAPPNTFHPDDIKEATHRFDLWLQEVSHGAVTLDRVYMAVGAVPVLGNIIALVDLALCVKDLYARQQAGQTLDALDWAEVGIDAIGLIPAPGLGAARMSLRTMLMEVTLAS